LLALTGDDEFDLHIQRKAVSLGMCLNEYGLWKSNSSDQWSLFEAGDEEAILNEIGMDFVDPEKRNFSFLKTTIRKQKDKEKKRRKIRKQQDVPRTDVSGFGWVGDSHS
jgi:DNA polymerase beta